MESIYYVMSWLCHRTCRHCYEDRFRPYYGEDLERVLRTGNNGPDKNDTGENDGSVHDTSPEDDVVRSPPCKDARRRRIRAHAVRMIFLSESWYRS